MTGVKESLELVSAVKLVGINAKKALADHKLNAEDLQYAMAILKDVQVLIDGIEGISHVGEEAKDIDEAEALQVGMAFLKAVKEIKNA